MTGKCIADLKTEVWEKGICSGCGACCTICPADAIWFDRGGDCRTPVAGSYCKALTDAVPCGACYAACPRTNEAWQEPDTRVEDLLGPNLRLVAGRAAFPVPGRQSGGAVTALLRSELESGSIDAIVTLGEDRRTLKPESVVITRGGETLLHSAGSRYNWWVPLLASLRTAVIVKRCQKIAVVGLPCAVAALSRIRQSNHELLQPYGSSIRLVIGLFCTELFDYRILMEEILPGRYSIPIWRIQHMDIRGALNLTLKDGSIIKVSLRDLEDAVRPGCHTCTDFTAICGDISAGSVGSPNGWTTLIARTPEGLAVITDAEQGGLLETAPGIDTSAILILARQKSARSQVRLKNTNIDPLASDHYLKQGE